MHAQSLNVSKQTFSDTGVLVHNPTQILDTDPVRVSRNEKRRADCALISYDCRFKDASRRNYSQRNKTRFYKIDVIKMPLWLLQNHTLSQDDRL
ncbi:hypothetical protein XI07_05105 [Bradyrhizobium sp. CCBAU 11445]|nr:hypothetical protein [Bradyrhizobium sp. CCBAU 11445]